jgi:hypothetical protein
VTDVQDPPATEVDADGAEPEFDREGTDPILRFVVEALNDHKEPATNGQGITLFVDGMVVAGEIIPAWQWFAEQNERQGPGSDSEEEGFLKEIADYYKGLEVSTARKPEFIHLRNATLPLLGAQSSNVVNMAPMYWRGQLAHVSGWVLGQMGYSRTES